MFMQVCMHVCSPMHPVRAQHRMKWCEAMVSTIMVASGQSHRWGKAPLMSYTLETPAASICTCVTSYILS